jgi:hypothetical protein
VRFDSAAPWAYRGACNSKREDAVSYRIMVMFIRGRRQLADSDVHNRPTPKKGDKIVAICNGKIVRVLARKVTMQSPIDQVDADEF